MRRMWKTLKANEMDQVSSDSLWWKTLREMNMASSQGNTSFPSYF